VDLAIEWINAQRLWLLPVIVIICLIRLWLEIGGMIREEWKKRQKEDGRPKRNRRILLAEVAETADLVALDLSVYPGLMEALERAAYDDERGVGQWALLCVKDQLDVRGYYEHEPCSNGGASCPGGES